NNRSSSNSLRTVASPPTEHRQQQTTRWETPAEKDAKAKKNRPFGKFFSGCKHQQTRGNLKSQVSGCCSAIRTSEIGGAVAYRHRQ
ncbi:hypothetical protein Ancab_038096, partial [Ancistrocladus abbreviatus]